MAKVKLTDTAWLARETERVKGILLANLPLDGMEQGEVLELLRDQGLTYTVPQLQQISANLIADGTIEIV